ncbi:FtsK/SpoIIIE domain-containing protein [Oceanobacillus oncorhynchi]|uniref:FtsK/SpoIIIE domain-containing protein n=1 Tax=Oceanobacillus oncorhynchi TaxID=545501 RepID=UPI0025A4B969|nr:FtsK/SpoIIIE domain-containing protein [Oceanobacillus oncorhynchi]MDM8098646.1 FtsK/SpoIIIE domain-containing protein [Oceanobacillus oncorhynchi]
MDLLIGGGLAAFTIYAAAKWQKSDKEKIQHTFRNLNYKVKDKEPKHFKTHKTDQYTLYSYHVPYGLVDDDKLNVLEKVLNKPVGVSFANQKLHIKVYKQTLPAKVSYDWTETEGWTLPIGISLDGPVMHDFDKIPHMTVAGMTRNGKSVLLKLILGHLINSNPDDVEFYVLDLKEKLEFGPYENLRQVKGVAGNVHESKEMLEDVLKNIKSDMADFRKKGYTNVLDTDIKKRKFIIVDEAAELAPPSFAGKDDKKPYQYCQHVLSEIARIAGALGYRLIYACQYPTAENMPRQIKQNADAKISFRLPTEVASRVALDEQGAETLNNVGRAIYRTAEKHVIQVPYVADSDIKGRFVDYVSTDEKATERRTDTVIFG